MFITFLKITLMVKKTLNMSYFVLALCYYHRTIAITIVNIFCVGYSVYLAELFIMLVVVDVAVVYYVCAFTAANDKAFFKTLISKNLMHNLTTLLIELQLLKIETIYFFLILFY